MREFNGTKGEWKQDIDNEVYDYGDGDEGYCEFFTVECDGYEIGRCQNENDAKLMAAAPELLEALLDLKYKLYGNGLASPKIENVINKALGVK